jgi:hypothetical protein
VLVIDTPQPSGAGDAAELLVRRFGLLRALFTVRQLPELPRLSKGKVDYPALAALASNPPASGSGPVVFLQAALREFIGILSGPRPLGRPGCTVCSPSTSAAG